MGITSVYPLEPVRHAQSCGGARRRQSVIPWLRGPWRLRANRLRLRRKSGGETRFLRRPAEKIGRGPMTSLYALPGRSDLTCGTPGCQGDRAPSTNATAAAACVCYEKAALMDALARRARQAARPQSPAPLDLVAALRQYSTAPLPPQGALPAPAASSPMPLDFPADVVGCPERAVPLENRTPRAREGFAASDAAAVPERASAASSAAHTVFRSCRGGSVHADDHEEVHVEPTSSGRAGEETSDRRGLTDELWRLGADHVRTRDATLSLRPPRRCARSRSQPRPAAHARAPAGDSSLGKIGELKSCLDVHRSSAGRVE